MLRTVKAKKYSLSLLGDVNACMEDVINLAMAQLLQCIGHTVSMTEARIEVWTARTGRN